MVRDVYAASHLLDFPCRNIHDDSLPVNVQCTSVRLLLNLVEVMFARRQDQRTAEAHRMLLVRSLDAFVSKLSAIKRSLPHLLPGKLHTALNYFKCCIPGMPEIVITFIKHTVQM